MIKYLRRLGQRGDTIVEVMVVLAILGLALSISYATANKGLQQSRNAQEHSQALGILDSQIELLRAAFARQAGSTLPSTPFCLAPPGASQSVNATSLAAGFNDADRTQDQLNTTTYPGPCTQDNLYHVSIMNRGGDVFDFRVRWEGISDLGRQQEELTYKINTVAAGAGGYTDDATPPTCPPGYTGTYPACVAPTCPPGYTGTPPACVLIPTNFTWTVNGNNYTSCVSDASDPPQRDNHDGCNPSADTRLSGVSANAVFARRGVDMLYKFATNGTLAGSINSGAAQLTINFNQYALANTKPPAGYSYHVLVKIDGTQVADVMLTPNSGHADMHSHIDPSWGAKDFTTSINIPTNTPQNIELDWVNNQGNDPDLQINTITLSRP